jgi:integrase
MRTYTAKHNKLDDAELRVRKIVQHYVLIAANSGLRVGEQRQLRWSDVQIEHHKVNGEELKDKPSELKRYEEKLREATFHYNRAEGYSSRGYFFRGIIDSLICRGKINDIGWKSLFFGMTKGMMRGEITS